MGHRNEQLGYTTPCVSSLGWILSNWRRLFPLLSVESDLPFSKAEQFTDCHHFYPLFFRCCNRSGSSASAS